jgi:hypothetical protein
MHIARIRHLFYPDMPRDYFYELSAQQVKMGHSVDVITWCKRASASEERVDKNFTVHRLAGVNLDLGGLVQDYPFLPELPSRLEIIRPEIIHGESHLFLPSIQSIRKAIKLGLPSVVSIHGVLAERNLVINYAQPLEI